MRVGPEFRFWVPLGPSAPPGPDLRSVPSAHVVSHRVRSTSSRHSTHCQRVSLLRCTPPYFSHAMVLATSRISQNSRTNISGQWSGGTSVMESGWEPWVRSLFIIFKLQASSLPVRWVCVPLCAFDSPSVATPISGTKSWMEMVPWVGNGSFSASVQAKRKWLMPMCF